MLPLGGHQKYNYAVRGIESGFSTPVMEKKRYTKQGRENNSGLSYLASHGYHLSMAFTRNIPRGMCCPQLRNVFQRKNRQRLQEWTASLQASNIRPREFHISFPLAQSTPRSHREKSVMGAEVKAKSTLDLLSLSGKVTVVTGQQ